MSGRGRTGETRERAKATKLRAISTQSFKPQPLPVPGGRFLAREPHVSHAKAKAMIDEALRNSNGGDVVVGWYGRWL